jgi:hypothetical protein
MVSSVAARRPFLSRGARGERDGAGSSSSAREGRPGGGGGGVLPSGLD